MDALCRLSDILNSIDEHKKEDNKKRGREEDDGEDVSTASTFEWIQYFDQVSMKYYYYNTKTRTTQWEQPSSFIPYQSATEPQNIASQRVAFNNKTGAFSSDVDIYHRPKDREGRQLSAFFDISTLEENRKEAKAKKDKLTSLKSIDWAEIRQNKKKLKKKLQNQWLLEDD